MRLDSNENWNLGGTCVFSEKWYRQTLGYLFKKKKKKQKKIVV